MDYVESSFTNAASKKKFISQRTLIHCKCKICTTKVCFCVLYNERLKVKILYKTQQI